MSKFEKRLTAFDYGVIGMVRSMLGTDCEPKDGGDHYYFLADYSKHTDRAYVEAVINSIRGRLGKRFISASEDADQEFIIVRVAFAESGAVCYTGGIERPKLKSGTKYARRLTECRAVQVEKKNIDKLCRFIGNGEAEIIDGELECFHFLNPRTQTYLHARVHEYIMTKDGEDFYIVYPEEFEDEWEKK